MSNFSVLYTSGRVKRFHTCDIAAQQIGQHSWGVCMILRAIYPKDLEVPSHLYEAAMLHDCAELVTGDIPAPAKWGSKRLCAALDVLETEFEHTHGVGMGKLTLPERRLLRWADTFELCLYSRHRLMDMGESSAHAILHNGLSHIKTNLGFPTTESKELYDEFFGE